MGTNKDVLRLAILLASVGLAASRFGLITVNPVKGIPKLREAGGRMAFLSQVGEGAVLSALPTGRCPLVILAINTGLRWSEQSRLHWLDADLLTGFLTVRLGKNGPRGWLMWRDPR